MKSIAPAPTAPAVPFAAPRLRSSAGLRLVRATADLWRVVDPSGHVIGHLQAIPHPLGLRYRARRYHPAMSRFRDIGDFWSPDDAVGALRAG
jgi:hypothetical protein